MSDVLLIALSVLFLIQIFTFYKVLTIIRQMNKLLFEVRLLFKHSGVYFNPMTKKVIGYNTCQYCRYRLSFIQISEGDEEDHFYYRCKKNESEIQLSDTCKSFSRDYSLK